MDFLEAGVGNGKITVTPKSLIDTHLAEGLKDAKNGRTRGPYSNPKEAVAALEMQGKRRARKV